MTTYYVDSAAGSNTSPYDTWAKAATSLATIAAIDAAGDTINVATTHSETGLASNPNYAWAGTAAAPTRIICVDKGTNIASTGATIATAAGVSLTFASTGVVYVNGMTLISGTGTSASSTLTPCFAATGATFENCTFNISSTAAGAAISFAIAGGFFACQNCTYIFGNVSQRINLAANGPTLIIEGGKIDATSAAITVLFSVSGGVNIEAFGFDFSNAATGLNILSDTHANVSVKMWECLPPASWSGSPNGSTPGIGSRASLTLTDTGATNYVLNVVDAAGTINQNTTVVMTGGATNGTTPISWTLATNSQAGWPYMILQSEWRAVWVDTTTSKTLTWNYVADSAVTAGQGSGTSHAFQSDEVYIEAVYLGSASNPLGTIVSSAPAYGATASDNAAGSASWTTTGLTTPKIGCCTLTFTTGMKGPMLARICVAPASKTIYADPDPSFA